MSASISSQQEAERSPVPPTAASAPLTQHIMHSYGDRPVTTSTAANSISSSPPALGDAELESIHGMHHSLKSFPSSSTDLEQQSEDEEEDEDNIVSTSEATFPDVSTNSNVFGGASSLTQFSRDDQHFAHPSYSQNSKSPSASNIANSMPSPSTSVPSAATTAPVSRRVKLKQFAVGLKQKWSDWKNKPKKVDPISQAAASAAAQVRPPLGVASGPASSLHPTASPYTYAVPSPISPPLQPLSSQQLSQTQDSLLSPMMLNNVDPAVAVHAHLATSPPSLASLHPVPPSPVPLPLDPKAEKEYLKEKEKELKQRLKEEARIEKARQELEKQRAKEMERQMKEARKLEEKLFKDRARAELEAKKQAMKQADLASKQMKQMLERAASAVAKNSKEVAKGASAANNNENALNDLPYMNEQDVSHSPLAPSKVASVGSLTPHNRAIEMEGHSLAQKRDSLVFTSSSPLAPGAMLIDSPSPTVAFAPSHRLGFVQLHIEKGTGINGKEDRGDNNGVSTGSDRWKQKTCVEVTYGGVVHRSETWVAGSNPCFNFKLNLPVYDITSDIIIHFILKHSLKKNEVFAMCVIPLTMLLNRADMWHPHEVPAFARSFSSFPGSLPPAAMESLLSQTAEDTESPQNSSRSLWASPQASPLPPASLTSLHAPSPPPLPASVSASSTQPLSDIHEAASSSSSSSSAKSSNSFTSLARELLNSLFTKRDFYLDEWFQLYPYNYDKAGTLWLHRFPAAEDTVLQSGMVRPKKDLGKVKVTCVLRFEQPLSYSYLHCNPHAYDQIDPLSLPPGESAPAPSPSHPVFIRPDEPLEFHKTVLKKNVRRIRRWLTAPQWLIVFADIFTWRIPLLTFYFVALWSYVCFRMPFYQYPFFLVLTCFLLHLWIVRFDLEDYSFIHTYQEDALPSNYLGEGHWKKFQRYKGIMAKISHFFGKTAAVAEKTSNLLNFTDVTLSIFAYGILFTLAALSSALLYIVPANVLIYLGGLSLFIRGGYRSVKEFLLKSYPDAWNLLFQKKIVIGSPSPPSVMLNTSVSGKTSGGDEVELKKKSSLSRRAIAQAKLSANEAKRWSMLLLTFIKYLLRSLKYLYQRSPDYYELAHRVLCDRAITKMQFPIVQPHHSPAAPRPSLSISHVSHNSLGSIGPIGGERGANEIMNIAAPSPSHARRLLFGAASASPVRYPNSSSAVPVTPQSSRATSQQTSTLQQPRSSLQKPDLHRSFSSGDVEHSGRSNGGDAGSKSINHLESSPHSSSSRSPSLKSRYDIASHTDGTHTDEGASTEHEEGRMNATDVDDRDESTSTLRPRMLRRDSSTASAQ